MEDVIPARPVGELRSISVCGGISSALDIHCSEIDVVVDERQPVGEILMSVQTIFGTVSSVISRVSSSSIVITEVRCTCIECAARVTQIWIHLNIIVRDIGRLTQKLEIDGDWEAIASHHKVVSEETTTCSNFTHITISMSQKLG